MNKYLSTICLYLMIGVTAICQVNKGGKGSASITTAEGVWQFQEFASNIIKVTFKPIGYATDEHLSDAVILKPAIKTRWKISSDGAEDKHVMRCKDFIISYNKGTIYFGKDSAAILESFQQNNEYSGFRFKLQEQEKIFGAGERALPLNRRGYRFNLYNNPWYGYGDGADNLNYSVPFITSSNHYALFFDNPSKGYLDIGKSKPDILEYGTCSGELNFYLITGADYPEILQSYYKLTGTQPLPPRWAMGSFMSRFGYTSEKQAKDIYAKMRADSIPFDAVIFDLFWFGDSIKRTLGNLDWVNRTKWPNPAKMISDFKKDGVNTILVTEPFILEGTQSYESFKPFLAVDSSNKVFTLTDFYFGAGGLVDIFRNDSKDKFWSYYKKQMDIGVEGWWGDLGEPEKHPSGLFHNMKDFGYNRLFGADEVHNIFGHNWTKMLYQKFSESYPDKRLFSLNRSGFAGTQRFSIFPWSGDVSRSWSGFKAQLPVMLGMSMSGVPYIHADAGGFAGGDGDKELYLRWLQFAQYTPIFRPHGTALYEVDPNAFSFPSEIAMVDKPYSTMAKKVVTDRYKMLPYNYTLSYEQAKNGAPIVSPLYYYFNSDTNSVNVGDEFMFGKSILVAPVLEKAVSNRNVYLPEGYWYQWKGKEKIKGGTIISEALNLESIPVFVKAGSIIPVLPEDKFISNTSQYSTKEICWHYYAADTETSFTLYDDDGASKNAIAEKKFELLTVKVSPKNNVYRLEINSNSGAFDGKPNSRIFHFIFHGASENLSVSGNGKNKAKMNKNNEMELEIEFSGKPIVLILKEEQEN